MCRAHGGRAPQVQRAAARRLAVAEARDVIRGLGIMVDADPLDVLLDMVREAAGNVAAYRLAISGLGVHVGPGGVATDAVDTFGGHVPPDVHILVKMYSDERDRLTRYAKMCLDCGVAERKVRVAEQQAGTLARLFGETLDELSHQLPADVAASARSILADKIRREIAGSVVRGDD